MSTATIVRDTPFTKPFGLLYGGYVVSALTDGLMPIVCTMEALRISSSPWALSTVLIVLWLGRMLVIPFSGQSAAHHHPLAVMICADVIRIASQVGLIAAIITSGNSVAVMAISALVYGMGVGIYVPAQQTALPTLVAHSALDKANAAFSAAADVSLIAGPAIGVLLFQAIGYTGVLALDCATFAVNIGLLVRLIALCRTRGVDWQPQHEQSENDDPGQRIGTIRSAYQTATTDRFLGTSMLFWTLASIVIGMIAVYAPNRVIETSGNAGAWAVISTVMAVSSLAGSVTAAVGNRLSYRLGVLAVGVLLVTQIIAITRGLASHMILMLLTYSVFGAGALVTTWSGIQWTTAVQRRLPREQLARFVAVASATTGVGVPVGMALGPVLTLSGGPWLLSAVGIALVSTAIAVTRTPARRQKHATP